MEASAGTIQRAARNMGRRGARAPLGELLASVRRRAAEAAISTYRESAEELAPSLLRGEPSARARLAELGDRALFDMRRRVHHLASAAGAARGWAASLDGWWRGTKEQEYLDDPLLDASMRVRILRHLDGLNDLLGSYRA